MFSFWKDESNPEARKKGFLILIVLGILAGVALLFLGNHEESKEVEAPTEVYNLSEDELIIYQKHLEERVRDLCATVNGVGSVTAIVTLEGGFSSEYAVEYKDGNEEYVILGSGSSQTGLFLSRTAPRIAGIGVVCQGGNDARVQKELTSLLSAAFDLPSNRIYVTQGKA